MKIARTLIAAVALVVVAAACDSVPTAPDFNSAPPIGSGVGTGTGPY